MAASLLPHGGALVACRSSFSWPAPRDRPLATKLDRALHCEERSADAISSGIHRGSARSLRCPRNDEWSNLMKLASFSTQILAVPEDDPLAGAIETPGATRPVVALSLRTDDGIEG